MQRGHEAVLGFERNHIVARQRLALQARIAAGLQRQGHQRPFGRIAHHAPLAVVQAQLGIVAQQAGAADVGEQWRLGDAEFAPLALEAPLRRIAGAGDADLAISADHTLHRHFIARQGAGLVRADHRDRAQRLDCRQAPDDGSAPCHALHADGKGDRHDRRQPLGDRRHRQADGGDEHVARAVVPDLRAKYERGHRNGKDDPGQELAEPGHLAQQRRAHALHRAEQRADAADLGGRARPHHHPHTLAVAHQRAREGHGGAIAERRIGGDRRDRLVDAERLTGERRLLDAQAAHVEQAKVGRDTVAGSKEHDVTRHQRVGGDLLPPPITQHMGVRREHVADGVEGTLGLALLQEADDRIDHRHPENDRGVDQMAQQGGHHPGRQQDVDEHIVELQQEAHQRTAPRRRRQRVGATKVQPAHGLVRVEAGVGRSAQGEQHGLRRLCVAGRWLVERGVRGEVGHWQARPVVQRGSENPGGGAPARMRRDDLRPLSFRHRHGC